MHFLLNNNERLFDMVEGGQLDIAYVMEPLRQKSMSLTPFFTEQMILGGVAGAFISRQFCPPQPA